MLSRQWARQYILRKGSDMSKLCVTIGYKKYVLDVDDAVKFTELLSNAEMYEEVSHKASEGGGTTHHVYDVGIAEGFSMHLISESLYQMAKLAGKPENRR